MKPLTLLWPAGLPVEARTPEEELGRTLVPAAAQLPLLFWERRVQREKGHHPTGRAVLCGGKGTGEGGACLGAQKVLSVVRGQGGPEEGESGQASDTHVPA